MQQSLNTFAELFKKYRLKSEFESLSDFGDALARKQLHFENSLFSHWQKGTRIPRDRRILLILIHLFIERGGMTTLNQVNEFLESAEQGYLTNTEIYALPKNLSKLAPFQAPKQTPYFTGREEYLTQLRKLLLNKKTILLHGPAGNGKTALAIKLAHELNNEFPDGVLWYRLDASTVTSILGSIAYTFGEDITRIDDIASKASIVRSILQDKKVLIIYDNLDTTKDLHFLLPSSEDAAVLFTSRNNNLEAGIYTDEVHLKSFTLNEGNELFNKIIGEKEFKKNQRLIEEFLQLVNNMPLAIQIVAQQIKTKKTTINEILADFNKANIELIDFAYENKNIWNILSTAFKRLTPDQRDLFLASAIFEGEDFSVNAVSATISKSLLKTNKMLRELESQSLIEKSKTTRWRIHPLIKLFLRKHKIKQKYYKNACLYFIKYLEKFIKQQEGYRTISTTGISNIVYIFEKCYELGYYEELMRLWENFSGFLWDTGNWAIMHKLSLIVYKLSTKTNNTRAKVLCCIKELSLYYYWRGDMKLSAEFTLEGLKLAKKLNDKYLIAFAKARMGKVWIGAREKVKAKKILSEALTSFKELKNNEQTANVERNLAEIALLNHELDKATPLLKSALSRYELISYPSLKLIYKSIVHCYLGAISIFYNNLKEAKEHFRKSLRYAKNGGEKSGESIWAHLGLGLTYELEKNTYEAKEAYIQAKEESLHLSSFSRMAKQSIFNILLEKEFKKNDSYKKFFL